MYRGAVKAIREHLAVEPFDGEILFPNRWGNQYSTHGMGRYFNFLKEKAGITAKWLTLDCFRDAAQHWGNRGKNVNPIHTEYLLGREVGVSDRYDPRIPAATQAVVDAIEDHFFPRKNKR